MNFSFSGRHMEIGESLTNKAKEAFIILAGKYGIEFIDANVVMTKGGYLFSCDISAKTNTGNSYYASDEANDPHVSFDVTLQKIDQQMKKKKKLGRCRFNKKQYVEINSFDNSLEEAAPMIVAETVDNLPILSVSDAAKRLNEKTKVFVFENISNHTINIVYTREDGNIGWINYEFTP
ncbi:MAG: HPF/RaiA family ribosome-associated protein [Holosporaceae bacterium]|jgi:ribosomal subunit interface protein|nr:HPF/RaiA family ribosome-associated protein [Holosporaceae bacterium]